MDDATFVADFLKNNIKVRFTEKEFSSNGTKYPKGTLVILRNDNRDANFDTSLVKIANKHQRKLTSTNTGFSDSGVDFGSYSVKPINKQKVGILSGKGTSSLSFGEIWHFFETQLQYPTTNINSDDFGYINFSDYDVIIIPSGYYSKVLNKNTTSKLQKWIRSGGTLIAIGNALNSFEKNGFSLKKKETSKKQNTADFTRFEDRERKNIANLITGSIFKSSLDNSHPLAFGYGNSYYSLKLSGTSYQNLKYGNNVAYFNGNAKNISGYAGSNALKKVPNAVLFGEETMGRGSVVYLVDNPLFRAFWNNGKLFVANAVFFLNSDKLD